MAPATNFRDISIGLICLAISIFCYPFTIIVFSVLFGLVSIHLHGNSPPQNSGDSLGLSVLGGTFAGLVIWALILELLPEDIGITSHFVRFAERLTLLGNCTAKQILWLQAHQGPSQAYRFASDSFLLPTLVSLTLALVPGAMAMNVSASRYTYDRIRLPFARPIIFLLLLALATAYWLLGLSLSCEPDALEQYASRFGSTRPSRGLPVILNVVLPYLLVTPIHLAYFALTGQKRRAIDAPSKNTENKKLF